MNRILNGKPAMIWPKYFLLSPESPSGLVWAIDVYDTLGRRTKAQAGRVAGSLSGQGRWQVGLSGKILRCHRIIYEMVYGEIPEGYIVDHQDGNCSNNAVSNLVLKTQKHNTMNSFGRSSNTSGVTGVSFWSSGKGNLYARAYWNDKDSKVQCKVYSVNKYGLLPAFAMACRYRENMLIELNKQGAMYTDRHGKGI